MNKRDLITIDSLSSREIFDILKLARRLKRSPMCKRKLLKDKTLALIFQKPSNRTRISFEVAMVHLGGYALYLSPEEIKMGQRESVRDVAHVVSRYVDGIVARVFSHDDIVSLAKYSDVPVINGLSDFAHPCQALSDIFTIKERFRRLKKVTLAYVGDGNNVLNSLLMVCANTGVNMRIATPLKYRPSEAVLSRAADIAGGKGAVFEIFDDPREAVRGSDVVYTDVWVSMGREEEKKQRMLDFKGFQVNDNLMREAKSNALIMHCLPAHRGEEISDIIDSKNSIVYDQAENRLHVQKAVLIKMLYK